MPVSFPNTTNTQGKQKKPNDYIGAMLYDYDIVLCSNDLCMQSGKVASKSICPESMTLIGDEVKCKQNHPEEDTWVRD